MGCINQRQKLIIISTCTGHMKLISSIKRLIKENPIQSIDLSNFKSIISNHINPNESSITKNIDSLLSRLPLTKLQESMLKDILTFASENLAFIYPSKSLFESICYTMYFFLCKENKENTEARKKFIYLLIDTTKEDQMIKTGQFTFLLFNIYKFLSYIMIYFFISPTMLEIYEEFTLDKLEVIYIQKAPCKNINPKSFSSYVINKMKGINSNFSNEKCTEIALQYIFKPIVSYFKSDTNGNSSKVFIENKDYYDVCENLEYFFDPYNMIDFLFTLKLKVF